ncbi:hypothetical protein PALB_2430 [Pseudoalteromonas luteoviolacea B = ATCC 29581]|nr:hypothetical protein PALB_2430 [Pseudoalteromonas luteoviolacea B = ATCC 29581]
MLFVSPWRMALIWFISGAAIRCLVDKQSRWGFLANRTVVILLPLLVGVWLVVPIQLFAQLQQEQGISLSLVEFFTAFFNFSSPLFESYSAGIWPHVDVNHLWYLRSLWQFSLIIIIVAPLLCCSGVQNGVTRLLDTSMGVCFCVCALPLLLLKFIWPEDTFRYPMGFVFLMYGFVFVHQSRFFARLGECAFILLALYLTIYLSLLYGYHDVWLNAEATQLQKELVKGLYTIAGVIGVAMVIGFGVRFLNFPSTTIKWLNQFVFPFYVLHQSVLIALAFYLAPFQLGGIVEPMAIIIGTFSICTLMCWGIARHDILRLCFGAKVDLNYQTPQGKRQRALGLLVVTPLIVELLY